MPKGNSVRQRTPDTICVDLAGTLVRTDTLLEGLLVFLHDPRNWMDLWHWSLCGPAALNRRVAARAPLDLTLLPYEHTLIDYLQAERGHGRRLVLATAADRELADGVNANLKLLDEVIASDGIRNLKGLAKRDALAKRFGAGNFTYVGNSWPDLQIWRQAGGEVLVNASNRLSDKVAKITTIERRIDDRPSRIASFLKTLRPHQWLKNVLVFLPILTANALRDGWAWSDAVMFTAFCSTASALYIVNDLTDLAAEHPRKRRRPFASGDLFPVLCVLCGEGAVADGVLNAALFIPLGAALSMVGWRPLPAFAQGAFLSCGVEAAQLVIPGRDPSLSDVLFNTVGTALGIALVRSASTLWRPERRLADVLTITGALGTMSVLALTGILLGPSFPEDTYYGGWTPRFGHLEWYGGRVLQVSLGNLELPPGVIDYSAQVRRELLAEATIVVRARAGPRPPGLAPLFIVHDGHQREILILGVDGDDIVYRYRTRAITWGLVGHEIRARGALRGIVWRAPLSVTVRRAGSGICVRVNATERCGLGYTIGMGWALLLGGQPIPLWLQPALNVVWLAALFFPTGRWARFGWAFAATAAFSLAGLLALPVPLGLLPTPDIELLGALAGFLTGWASNAQLGLLSG